MSNWKYVVIKKGNQEIPIIFPDTLVHAHVAGVIKAMFVQEALMMIPPGTKEMRDRLKKGMLEALPTVSAGDVAFEVFGCSGASESIGIGSRDETDIALIRSWQYTKGVDHE